MQKSDQLDELDYSLVNALQIAPRAPWSLIGEVLGISPVTAARRWERLTGEGHAWMTGYCSSPLWRDMPYVLVTLGCAAGSVRQVADALARRLARGDHLAHGRHFRPAARRLDLGPADAVAVRA